MISKIVAALGYVFGGFFAILGVVSLFGDPAPALPLLLIAILLLPPTSRWLQRQLGETVNAKSKAVAIFILFLVFGAAAGYEEERDRATAAEEAEQARAQDQRDRFSEGRDSILSQIQTLISEEKYSEALAITRSLTDVDDDALTSLQEVADSGHQRTVARERERQLVELVRTVPATETKRNMEIYRELADLDPANQRYRERFEHYQQTQQREEQRRRRRAAFLGEQPVASAWDGTYREVKEYLRAVARDPDSVDVDACTKVYEADEGWLVACDWRARNGFGGMNRESNWFVIRQGRVVEMKPLTAYSL